MDLIENFVFYFLSKFSFTIHKIRSFVFHFIGIKYVAGIEYIAVIDFSLNSGRMKENE